MAKKRKDCGLMQFCPRCRTRLFPAKFSVDGEKPKYTKVWEYGKGWQTIEKEEAKAVFTMTCPRCGYKSEEEEPKREAKRRSLPEKERKPIIRAKSAPLPDMPLARRRYYPGYMSPNEWFRDELRQADMVESITRRRAPAKQTEKKERSQEDKK